MAFTKPIFMKLTITLHYYMEISFTEFNGNRSWNMESTNGNSFMLLRQVRMSLGLFSRNLLLFRTFFKDVLCRISWEKDRRCSFVTNSRTNGQMYTRTCTPHKT